MNRPHLPYFDRLFEGRQNGEPAARAFELFVHWGYWEEGTPVEHTVESFRDAVARLDAKVLSRAELRDGNAHLDVGCGFGGTLKAIDAKHRDMRLVGINIDMRQLEIARSQVAASPDNTLEFVQADACTLPVPGSSFDTVSAVEAIFHFPSRFGFLAEAARVLKPGGRLVLSDFVPQTKSLADSAPGTWLKSRVARAYGSLGGWPDGGYHQMAPQAGLDLISDLDVTPETLPTYSCLDHFFKEAALDSAESAAWSASTRWLRWLSHARAVRYRIVAFQKPPVARAPHHTPTDPRGRCS